MLVTLAGHDMMMGRALLVPTLPSDYAHLIIACLMHDIGYVRGILKDDGPDGYVIDATGRKVKLPRGSSDAALLPYHVNRSKLFVMDRIATSDVFDAARIAHAIEFTRFPISAEADDAEHEEGSLVRAADLIGQFGDPQYLRKANALYYEFDEVGMNKQLGYTSSADLVDLYCDFIGIAFPRISNLQSAISTSPQVGGNGSQIFTATCSVLSTICIYQDHSNRSEPRERGGPVV